MSKTFAERLKGLIDNKGMSVSAASKAAGVDRATLRKLLDGTNQQPSVKTLEGLSSFFNVSRDWLMTGNGDGEPPPTQPASPPQMAAVQRSSREITIKGTVSASYSQGAPSQDTGTIGTVPPPPALASISGIYALYVDGASMEPQFFSGDLIFLNPARPPRLNDCVVVITDHGTGPQRTLGILEAEDAEFIRLHKHTREGSNGLTITIPKKYVKARHKVLSTNEMFGA
ncbi:XRE family transcriptional regulator [Martelella soudanensis]|uniref:XRE family transcriptional regulator n=1 Tax=unclassified Martelella TaxID=2629616 RepID=UPI0015DFEAF1|nr:MULTISPECIES: LexA family transcriptional regulator [unclassified Martelella]